MRRCCARRRSRCRCGGSTKPQPPVTLCCASGSRRTARAAPEAPAVHRGERVSIVKVLPELRAAGGAQMALGVTLDGARASAYQRSALCFASVLRHDLIARGEKLVAVAQARSGGRVLVHGSVLERRPPDELAQVAETLLGEPWQGDGLAGVGYVLAPEMIWKRVLVRLEAALQQLVV